jgi:integrase
MAKVRMRRGKWVLDYRDATGQRHVETSGTNKKEAERQLRQILNQIDDGTFRPDGKKMKFSDYATNWVAGKKADLKHGTWNTYNGQLTRYLLNPELGLAEKKLASMNRPTVMAFKQALIKKHSKLRPRSVNHILTLLGSILQSAVLDGYISINAARLVKKLPIEHREMEILSPKDIQKLLVTAEKMDWDLYVMVFLLVMTGMRRGEMLGLDWKSVDFPNKKLIIRRGYTNKRLQEPKTKSSRRAVNLGTRAINLLKRHRLKKDNPSGSTLLFDRGDGHPLDPDTLSSFKWPRLLRAAEIRESVRLHDLRHTFCSLLIAQGANPKYIQGQLGHSSIMMTMDRYGHLMPETNEKETELLDETVFGKEKGSGYKLGTSD